MVASLITTGPKSGSVSPLASSSPVVARVSFVGDVFTDFSRARRRVRASPLASPLARRSSDARGAEPTICEDRIVVASDGAISAGKIDPS